MQYMQCMLYCSISMQCFDRDLIFNGYTLVSLLLLEYAEDDHSLERRNKQVCR